MLQLESKPKPNLRIRVERQRQGLRQLDLAYRANVPLSELSRIETGRTLPYPAYAERLAAVLGLRPEELQENCATGCCLRDFLNEGAKIVKNALCKCGVHRIEKCGSFPGLATAVGSHWIEHGIDSGIGHHSCRVRKGA